ncbi:hypothetical protein NDU88_003169, partial [Pleurodeles waltl]
GGHTVPGGDLRTRHGRACRGAGSWVVVVVPTHAERETLSLRVWNNARCCWLKINAN